MSAKRLFQRKNILKMAPEDYRKRLEFLKKRDDVFGPLNYGNILMSAFKMRSIALPVVLMIFDMQSLHILKITDNCFDVWGYTKSEMEWTNISKLIHPEDLSKSISLADESIAKPRITIRRYKNRHIAKDGKIVYLRWTTTKTFNYQTLCFIEPITEDEFLE